MNRNQGKGTLRENCPYSEFFRSVFFRIRTEYGEIRSISPHSVRMRENTNQKNSEYEHFLRSRLLRRVSMMLAGLIWSTLFEIALAWTKCERKLKGWEREGTIFYSTLPLPPAHEHGDIYLQHWIFFSKKIARIEYLSQKKKTKKKRVEHANLYEAAPNRRRFLFLTKFFMICLEWMKLVFSYQHFMRHCFSGILCLCRGRHFIKLFRVNICGVNQVS